MDQLYAIAVKTQNRGENRVRCMVETYQPLHFIETNEEIGIEIPSELVGQREVSNLVRDLLNSFGENPEREGLKKTPERVARMFTELLSGYNTDPEELLNGAVFDSNYQDMVVVRDIEFYSLCEHHMLPFFGSAHVAYIPDGKIVGLSKIPRLVEMFSRRLQVQERLTEQIAEALESLIHPKGVAVVVEGAHMCAMMRGVKKSNARMITSSFLGVFKEDEKLKSEYMNHLKRGASGSMMD